jgi:hypothetical protein
VSLQELVKTYVVSPGPEEGSIMYEGPFYEKCEG